MSAMWVIYFAEISDGLKEVANGIGVTLIVIGGILAFVGPMYLSFANGSDRALAMPYLKPALKWWLSILVISGIAHALLPSSRTIYMMAAAKVGQDIVASPETKEISGKVLKLINEKLDEQLSKKEEKK